MHGLIEELYQYHKEKAVHLLDLERGTEELSEDQPLEKRIEIFQDLFEPFYCAAESAHHSNEEAILAELRKTDAPIHRRVDEISADHEAFERISTKIWARMSDQATSPAELRAAIAEFVGYYKDHADGEEMIFFPIADAHLRDSHWRRVRKIWK